MIASYFKSSQWLNRFFFFLQEHRSNLLQIFFMTLLYLNTITINSDPNVLNFVGTRYNKFLFILHNDIAAQSLFKK